MGRLFKDLLPLTMYIIEGGQSTPAWAVSSWSGLIVYVVRHCPLCLIAQATTTPDVTITDMLGLYELLLSYVHVYLISPATEQSIERTPRPTRDIG